MPDLFPQEWKYRLEANKEMHMHTQFACVLVGKGLSGGLHSIVEG